MALTTFGLMSRIQVNPVCFFQFICFEFLTSSTFLVFSASVRPHITDEQEAFIHRVTEIPLDKQKCRDLITLDTLHAYCRGPKPTLKAHRRKFIHFNPSFFFLRRLV